LIGNAGHDEVVGTLGQAQGVQLVEGTSAAAQVRVHHPDRVACVTQTTLSTEDVQPVLDRLRDRFPALVQPAAADICFATRNRQAAVAWLARNVDVVLVLGDETSSNSQRLREVVSAAGTPAHLIASSVGLKDEWLTEAEVVGVSAGASTPETVVAEVVDHLCREGAVLQEESFLDERVSFALPSELVASQA
jgi:4-hydroxy-3-methylbut-2-en-1-yl diphosphate reductase